ncbi:MAG TPA: hypothetical protein VIN59_02955 [Alphaproteobacteria bacterium]
MQHDAREKPLDRTCHTDPLSYVAAGTDEAEDTEHLVPYEEDAVFKGPAGSVLAGPMAKLNNFWVEK